MSISIECKVGSLIIFNSQLFHCAGQNKTDDYRVAINNVFTNPLAQQIIIPKAIKRKTWTKDLNFKEKQFLGFNSMSPDSDIELKLNRLDKEAKI